jgi:hypothetical protein
MSYARQPLMHFTSLLCTPDITLTTAASRSSRCSLQFATAGILQKHCTFRRATSSNNLNGSNNSSSLSRHSSSESDCSTTASTAATAAVAVDTVSDEHASASRGSCTSSKACSRSKWCCMTVEPSDPAASVFVDGVQAVCATQLKHGSRLVSLPSYAKICNQHTINYATSTTHHSNAE